jgi:uncharacterized protein YxeA
MKFKIRNIVFRIIICLFALIVIVGVIWTLAEVSIRLYFLYQDNNNPYIRQDLRKNATISEAYDLSLWEDPGVKYKKNAFLELDLPDGERLEVRINSKGFRTGEFTAEKPDGLFRILCVGGSTTVIGRTNEETYPALLEERLLRRFPEKNLEVLNLGISKYGTREVVNLCAGAIRYHPDLVIKYNGANDLWWDYFIMLKDTLPAWKKWALKSYAFQWFFQGYLLPPEQVIRRDLRSGLFPPLEYLSRMLEKADCGLVILTFFSPNLKGLTPAQKYYLDFNVRHFWGQQIGTFPFIRIEPYLKVLAIYNETLREFCQDNNITCIDLAREYPDDFDLYIDICHFSQAGIERAGELICEELIENKMIKK